MVLRGQATTEQMIVFAITLIVLIVALSLAVVWPGYVRSVEGEQSGRYWALERPFSVKDSQMYPDQMVIELENAEPVTLTITAVYLDGARLNFSNYSIPFDWSSASPRCASGSCAMTVRPGQTQVIATDNFTSSPSNPCVADGAFYPGGAYRMGLAIAYHASDQSDVENESGTFKLVGTCTQPG